VLESASMIKVRFPYLNLCLENVASLKLGIGVNSFDIEFNGIEDFVGGIRIRNVVWRSGARGAIVVWAHAQWWHHAILQHLDHEILK